MKQANQPSKIAFVSDYLPRRCGIATFTHDLRGAVAAEYPDAECAVLAIDDLPEGSITGRMCSSKFKSIACVTIRRR